MELRREVIPDLLNTLDAAVVRGGPSGFDAQVTVGVEVAPDRALWWVAHLGPVPTTHFTTELPIDVDAGLLVGASEAEQLLRPSGATGDHLATFGEVALLERLIARYLRHRSPVDTRAALPPSAKKKRKAR